MISDAEAEKAADWLLENAPEAGRLRGERVKAEAMGKHLIAVMVAHSKASSATARESEAYASDRYRDHLEALAKAVTADEHNRALREAAIQRIEIWRSESANARGRL